LTTASTTTAAVVDNEDDDNTSTWLKSTFTHNLNPQAKKDAQMKHISQQLIFLVYVETYKMYIDKSMFTYNNEVGVIKLSINYTP